MLVFAALVVAGGIWFLGIQEGCRDKTIKGLAPGWYAGIKSEKRDGAVSFSRRFATKAECEAFVENEVAPDAEKTLLLECFNTEEQGGSTGGSPSQYAQMPASGTSSPEDRRPAFLGDGGRQDGDSDSSVLPFKPASSPDTTPPVISINGSASVTVTVGEEYRDAGAQAADLVDGDLTDAITVSGLPIDTSRSDTHTVTYAAEDKSGNRATKTRTVVVRPWSIDASTDVAYIASCSGRPPAGPCAVADLNGDGAISDADGEYLGEYGARYDVNLDAQIDLMHVEGVASCFLKTEGGSCASAVHPDLLITASYLSEVESAFDDSLASGYEFGVDLSRLSLEIGSGALNRIVYASTAQYDLNGDGIADFSSGDGNADINIIYECGGAPVAGQCKKADINGDGAVGTWDLILMRTVTSRLLPDEFTLAEFDGSLFDWKQYGDADIVAHCIEKGFVRGNCENADINGDGAVDAQDREAFGEAARFDLNNDNVVNGQIILFFQ